MNKNNASNFVVTLSLDAGEMTLDVASIKEFYFVEDIFSFCVTGKIIFSDHRGILEFGPITGNEKISVVYGEEVDTEKVFFIYKISDISKHETTENGRNQLIEIFFVDQMFYSLNFFQFSKSWSNKRISDIITDISKNILGVTT